MTFILHCNLTPSYILPENLKDQGACFSFLLLLSYLILQGIRPTPGTQLCFLLESGRLNQRTARCLKNVGSLSSKGPAFCISETEMVVKMPRRQ